MPARPDGDVRVTREHRPDRVRCVEAVALLLRWAAERRYREECCSADPGATDDAVQRPTAVGE